MLLDKNARMTDKEIAVATGMTEEAVKAEIARLQENGTIKGYTALIDWEKTERNYVTAQIAVKVSLNGKMGFDDIADLLAGFEEVESVSLMSGAYDISLTVSGKTFQEIAMFVAKELAVIDSVTSTATNFIMKQYKEFSVELCSEDDDWRDKISL